MNSYKNGNGNTVISTHIAPEGFCNLNCKYCSVKKRTKNFRIELEVIKDYVEKLMSRGLKAVILTGGGDPSLYPKINELLTWLKYEKKLSVALITNGTRTERIEDWKVFSWVRVSINEIENWKDKITLPIDKIPADVVIGCSYINTGNLENTISDLTFLLNKIRSTYLRVLPNCLLSKNELIKEHEKIDIIFKKYNVDNRFFHQYKIHGTPTSNICHQSYFRPYLSEVDGGTVYPCDSLVLNENVEYFHKKYRICKADEILEFLDKKIACSFDPTKDCSGCVFHENIKILDDWYSDKINLFSKFKEKLFHEEFV